jgi:hypothetical protein
MAKTLVFLAVIDALYPGFARGAKVDRPINEVKKGFRERGAIVSKLRSQG